MQVSDNRAYCGAFQMLTLCVWGALEIQIDPFTFGATGQVRLIATLWCDVAIRLPSAFAISEAITPLP